MSRWNQIEVDPRAAHADRTDADRDLALWQMAVARQPLAAIIGRLVGIPTEQDRDLSLGIPYRRGHGDLAEDQCSGGCGVKRDRHIGLGERVWVRAVGSLSSARIENTARSHAGAHGSQCG
jgi:hypothetical protein